MEKALIVFSACGELVDDAIGVDFAGFQAARGASWVYGAFAKSTCSTASGPIP
jgi:hypothetical protein